jgi:hypothetical protein
LRSIVRSQLYATQDCVEVVHRGDHDYRHISQSHVRLHLVKDSEAIQFGHLDVEQHEIESLRA